ncbi:unnamed protein product, partial [Staurois parvus]
MIPIARGPHELSVRPWVQPYQLIIIIIIIIQYLYNAKKFAQR